jgi:tetratricopeptide (TPR) repeat protein
MLNAARIFADYTPVTQAPPLASELQALLKEALGHHRAGRWMEAEVLYRRILEADARNADSLHLLGMVEHQRGRHETAASMIRQAIAIQANVAAFHSNLGAVLQAQGMLEEAAVCFTRALSLQPDWAEVYSNLGNILQSLGKLEEAIAHQQRALALNPGLAEAWSNLGNIWYAQGKIAESITCFERALALKPAYVDAHNNLGAALLSQDRSEAAIGHFEAALALNPDYAAAHNNLGNALLKEARLNDAQTHYERALTIKPDYANAHNNLGNVLKEKGQFEEAMAHYERAIALQPDYAAAHLNRTELKRFTRGEEDLAALEKLAASEPAGEKAMFLHFALAKALDDVGDYDRAWGHLMQGNALKRVAIEYPESRALGLLDHMREVFEPGLFERLGGAGDPSRTPIFVVGMPRSGSTLVEQILASHPQVHGAGELTVLERMEDPRFPDYIPGLNRDELRRLGEAYLAQLPRVPAGMVRIADKLPGNFFRIGLIRLILPNARIVHTMRHPLDTSLSCYFKLFTNGLLFTYDLGELGRYYRSYSRLMDHWRSVLPPDTMLDVRYEDVVGDLEGQARRLIEFCGLGWDENCIGFHRHKRPVRTASSVQVRQPLFRSSLERWRHYESGLGPLRDALSDALAPR